MASFSPFIDVADEVGQEEETKIDNFYRKMGKAGEVKFPA